MKKISFTIKGNQENPKGNPIPYLRTTQKSQWTDKAIRYHEWKDYVRAAYIDALQAKNREKKIELLDKKPIPAGKEKQKMSLQISFKDKTHGDCDNIFKGIADALFMNDKNLIGDFDFEYSPKKEGKVIVTLNL